MKTYVITASKVFLKGHPRAGEPTNFREKILNDEKIHTIRGNIPFWSDIVEKVNAGEAKLSLREWIGAPYKSKQSVIREFTKLGFQELILGGVNTDAAIVDCYQGNPPEGMLRKVDMPIIAKNDGLDFNDFTAWFPAIDLQDSFFHGGIIHFTDFRY